MPPRKKNVPAKAESSPQQARIEVLVPFNGMYRGDTADVVVEERVQGWIDAGWVRVVQDGADQTGPGESVADNPGSVATRAGDSSPSGDEPGQGFGAGGYGAFEG